MKVLSERQISGIITEICGVEAEDITPELDLFDAGFLDSFGTLELLVKLSEAFDTDLDASDIAREDILSVARIIETLSKKKGIA